MERFIPRCYSLHRPLYSKEIFTLLCFPPLSSSRFSPHLSLSIYIYPSIFPSSVRSSLYSWTARRMDDQFPCSTSLATSFNALPRNEKKIYVTYNWYRRSPLWLEKLSSDTAFPFEIRRNYNYKRALDRSFSLSLCLSLSPSPFISTFTRCKEQIDRWILNLLRIPWSRLAQLERQIYIREARKK